MVEAIRYKIFCEAADDLHWPQLVSKNPCASGRELDPRDCQNSRSMFEDSDDDDNSEHPHMKDYWKRTLERYQAQISDHSFTHSKRTSVLPLNWTVVNINVTEDRNTLFLSRQRADRTPIVVCLPLKGRRDTHDDQHLGFTDALSEFQHIIRLSDEGTRAASQVDKDDKAARAAWWSSRSALDGRLQALLKNIEFCWLGAFKVSE